MEKRKRPLTLQDCLRDSNLKLGVAMQNLLRLTTNLVSLPICFTPRNDGVFYLILVIIFLKFVSV
jgi:hypothetical protein